MKPVPPSPSDSAPLFSYEGPDSAPLVSYEGPIWEGPRPVSQLARELCRRDRLVELRSSPGEPDCLLAVPHHAGPGIDQIAERRPEGGRVADENAVLYALAAYSSLAGTGLRVRLVVAVCATDHDPNKDIDSPYCQALFGDERPRLLVECHGAGWGAPHELEVSAGGNTRTDPLGFGRRLARALGRADYVAAQVAPGSAAGRLLDGRGRDVRASRLKFPALRTTSLREAGRRGMAAIHLEARPRFRTFGVRGLELPRPGAELGTALAGAIRTTLRPGGRAIPAT